MATIFRTPCCAYPRALLHGLQAVGLPHLPPAHLACEAAHTRYAMQAADIWRPQAAMLHHAREEHLPLAHAFGRTPEPGWGTTAMAFQLEEAWCRGEALLAGAAGGRAEADEPRENVAVGEGRQRASALQQSIYVCLRTQALTTPMSVSFAPRVISCVSQFSDLRPDMGEVVVLIDTCSRSLRKGAGILVLHLARTWCNAWATMHRLQKGCGPCVWGCSSAGRDSLAHLLVCPVLRQAAETKVEHCLAHPLARAGFGGDRRHGGGGPPVSVLGLAVAVQTYHRRQDRPLNSPEDGSRWAAAGVESAYRQLSILR